MQVCLISKERKADNTEREAAHEASTGDRASSLAARREMMASAVEARMKQLQA
jgi:hypothetical protein